MPPKNNKLNKWKVDSFRITGFQSPTADIQNVDSWWEEITGDTPENIVSHPKKDEISYEGTFEGELLKLRIQPIRIDWIARVQKDKQVNSKDYLTLGEYPDVKGKFFHKIRRWIELPDFPSMRRLAFATELLQSVNSIVDGNKVLAEYLEDIDLDVENAFDFSYKINRRRSSTVLDGLNINRLTTWSTQTIKSARIQMQVGDVPGKIIEQGKDIIHAKLSLDVNTDPNYDGKFNKKQSESILNELVEYSEEIAIEGDIP